VDTAAGLTQGDEVVLEVRGRELGARLQALPFVRAGASTRSGGSR
jgi:hypothetical protein